MRWGDADATGRLRLDSIARYLQDVANDDSRDAGFDPSAAWVVRRTVMVVEQQVRGAEMVEVTTFCGGLGRRWAERRTSLTGDRGGRVEAAALWVRLDPRTGRPAPLDQAFLDAYGEAAGGREVSARLQHGPAPGGAQCRPWPLRSTDVDRFGHANNAATWEAVEDELARLGVVPAWAEMEYRDAIEPSDAVQLLTAPLVDVGIVDVGIVDVGIGDVGTGMWLTVDGTVRASAVVSR